MADTWSSPAVTWAQATWTWALGQPAGQPVQFVAAAGPDLWNVKGETVPRILNTLSGERIIAYVTARTPHGTGVDIHADTVEIALVAPGGVLGTAPGDWKTATIDPVPVVTDGKGVSTWAIILQVTPGMYPAGGPYMAYVRPHDNPDTPVKPFDAFTFVTT